MFGHPAWDTRLVYHGCRGPSFPSRTAMSPTSRRSAVPSLWRAAAAAWLLPLAALAQQPQPTLGPTHPAPVAQGTTPLPVTPRSAAAMTAADLDAFFDGVIPIQLRKADIAGAVVSVVKGGQV